MNNIWRKDGDTLSIVVCGVCLFFLAWSDASAGSDEIEARARSINKTLRCMVCQNQSIEDSQTELASDMRRVVREQILSGATDDEIFRFLADRYGDFVTLMPPFKPSTWFLWLAPVVFLLTAVWTVRSSLLPRSALLEGDDEQHLSEEEERRLHLLIQKKTSRD